MSAEVQFRRAQLADLEAIVTLLAADAIREKPEDLGPPLPLAYREAFAVIDADPSQELVVAELDGRIIGTLQVTFIPYLMYRGGTVAMIESVRIAKELRGRGLGERLMRHGIEVARARGSARVQLTSNKQRKDAHRFYDRLGFVGSHEGYKLFFG